MTDMKKNALEFLESHDDSGHGNIVEDNEIGNDRQRHQINCPVGTKIPGNNAAPGSFPYHRAGCPARN